MIVVDANVIAYFWLGTARADVARRVRKRDSVWAVPPLWRSEFRSILMQHMTRRGLPYSKAIWYADKAEADLRDAERDVKTSDVLKLVEQTGHSAYDCEYVALAQDLRVPLVTGDRALAEAFPRTAVAMEAFADG